MRHLLPIIYPVFGKSLKYTVVSLMFFMAFFQINLYARTYYVNPTGTNSVGSGTQENPWRTIRYAADQVDGSLNDPQNRDTLFLSEGVFLEDGQISLKPGVSLIGAGIDKTIITATSSFYHTEPFYENDPYPFYEDLQNPYPLAKMLISASSRSGRVEGNQTICDFTIDGQNKQIYGGLLTYRRKNIHVFNIKVKETYFVGIWLFWTDDIVMHDINIRDCSWGNSGFSSGGINLGGVKRADLYNIDLKEREQREGDKGGGYGVVAIGPWFENDLIDVKLHDSKIIVHHEGLWENGLAPNFCIEYHNVSSYNCEIYRNEVNNVMSLVDPTHADPKLGFDGKYQRDYTLRVYENYFNISNENGYPMEITNNRIEVFNNVVNGNGTSSLFIANWETQEKPVYDWYIHHNFIYDLASGYPKTILMLRQGMEDLHFEHNTIEVSDESMSLLWFQGGNSKEIFVQNNLVYRKNEEKSWGQPIADCLAELNIDYGWETEVSDLFIENNIFHNFDGEKFLKGGFTRFDGGPNGYQEYPPNNVTTENNLSVDPQVFRTGEKPEPYFWLKSNSPAIDAGKILEGQTYFGDAPDIGALEIASETGQVLGAPDTTYLAFTTCASSEAGSDTTMVANPQGAESIVISMTSWIQPDTVRVNSLVCNPVLVGEDTLRLTNHYGCDSTVITTYKLIPEEVAIADTTHLTINTCDASLAGSDTTLFLTSLGCDSVVITSTIYREADTTRIAETSCNIDLIGEESLLLRNQFGCDSLVVITTSLAPLDTTQLEQTTCNPALVGESEELFSNQYG